MTNSVFEKYRELAWPHRFNGTLLVRNIVGGIPTDPKVASGWLTSKLAAKDDVIRDLVAQTMVERGVDIDEATRLVDENKHLNGFKRDDLGLYIEGRQLKAAIKEAASVAVAAGKLNARGWGTTNKGLLSFVAEHIFVLEDRLPLGVTQPTGIIQSFPHTWRGTGIQYEEYVEDAKVDFSIVTDHQFSEKEWAMIWLTGGNQGLGASRSRGFGRYEVVRWEQAS